MVKHYTDKELREVLKGLSILVDTREQVNDHITDVFDKQKVTYKSRKLDIGDYSAELDGFTLERSVAIERKHNLDELAGNLGSDRDRFEREFLRAKAYGTKVYLVIENATLNDIHLHNYRSKLPSESMLASLWAWQTRFNLTIIFCDKKNTASEIFGILYYTAREMLLYGHGG